MMVRLSIIALAVFSAAASLSIAAAQSGRAAEGAQERESRGAVVGYFAAGVSRIATGELDERLAARGYPAFGRTAAAVAVGAYGILPGGVMLGAEWHGLIMGDEAHEGRTVGLGGGYGTIGAGYDVELSPRVRIYPRLGIGGGGMGVWMQREGEAVGFDEVLADPDRHAALADSARSAVLSHGGMVVDLGAGAEFLPGGWGRGLLIGLRLGYLAAPSTTSWGLYERPVSGGPAASVSGPYVRLIVGGGPRW